MEEKKSIYENSETVEWGGNINEFFWLCSGSVLKIKTASDIFWRWLHYFQQLPGS